MTVYSDAFAPNLSMKCQQGIRRPGGNNSGPPFFGAPPPPGGGGLWTEPMGLEEAKSLAPVQLITRTPFASLPGADQIATSR